jgi:hypothetical protein
VGKNTQGATPAGDASSNPAATIEEATAQVVAQNENLPAGDEPAPRPLPPKKVKGMETDQQIRQALRNPRMEAMERIAAGRVEAIEAQEGVTLDRGEPTPFDSAGDPDVDPADAEAEKARKELGKGGAPNDEPAPPEPSQTQRQLEGDVIDDPSRFKVRLKVDGQEMLVPLSDIVRPAQKEAAANKRLEEATRMLAEAKAATAAPPAAPAPAPAPVGPRLETKKAEEFADAVYSGDQGRLVKSLMEVAEALAPPQGTQATSVIPEEVIQRVVEQQLRKTEVSSALSRFRSENPEIVKDPHLALIADQFLASETQGVPLEALPIDTVKEALNNAAKNTRDWATALGMQLGPKPAATTPRQDRAARKQEIDELPSISAASSNAADRPQTPQEVMNEMRAARGLPPI